MNKISSIIFTCDKNLDLSQYFLNTYEKLKVFGDVLILGETKCNDDVEYIFAGLNRSFKEKLVFALSKIKTEYVLIMLDDYYLLKNVENLSKKYVEILEGYEPDYLKICKDFVVKKRTENVKNGLKKYKKPDRYDLNFHPSIWKTSVLKDFLSSVQCEDIGHLEALFSKYASDNSIIAMFVTKDYLPYKELVVEGKFFRKPFKKYCKKNYYGVRKICSFWFETKYKIRKFLSIRMPRCILRFFKYRIFKKKDYYSD